MVAEIDSFDFYPHSCVIYRDAAIDPTTGEQTLSEIYRGRCYLRQGRTNFKGEWLQGEDTVMLDNSDIVILAGDCIDVVLDNGLRYSARIKQAYPLKDGDLGGQDLKLYQRDAVEQ